MHFALPKAFPKTVAAMGGCLALIASMAAPAAAQSAGSGWQPGPNASGDASSYTGYVDQPHNGATVPGGASFAVTGWFVDTTAQGWAGADNMQVWLGAMGGGGKEIAQGGVAQSRPDVATATGNPFYAASGFSALVPGGSVPAGGQTLSVYLHTPGKGWWFKTVSVTVGGAAAPPPTSGSSTPPAGAATSSTAPTGTVTAPTEAQNVSAKGSSTFTIQGTATDPQVGPSAIDSVDVWIMGERGSDSGQDLGQATLNGDGTWSLTFSPTKFPSTHTNIYVYIHSKASGQTTELIRGFNIVG